MNQAVDAFVNTALEEPSRIAAARNRTGFLETGQRHGHLFDIYQHYRERDQTTAKLMPSLLHTDSNNPSFKMDIVHPAHVSTPIYDRHIWTVQRMASFLSRLNIYTLTATRSQNAPPAALVRAQLFAAMAACKLPMSSVAQSNTTSSSTSSSSSGSPGSLTTASSLFSHLSIAPGRASVQATPSSTSTETALELAISRLQVFAWLHPVESTATVTAIDVNVFKLVVLVCPNEKEARTVYNNVFNSVSNSVSSSTRASGVSTNVIYFGDMTERVDADMSTQGISTYMKLAKQDSALLASSVAVSTLKQLNEALVGVASVVAETPSSYPFSHIRESVPETETRHRMSAFFNTQETPTYKIYYVVSWKTFYSTPPQVIAKPTPTAAGQTRIPLLMRFRGQSLDSGIPCQFDYEDSAAIADLTSTDNFKRIATDDVYRVQFV